MGLGAELTILEIALCLCTFGYVAEETFPNKFMNSYNRVQRLLGEQGSRPEKEEETRKDSKEPERQGSLLGGSDAKLNLKGK